MRKNIHTIQKQTIFTSVYMSIALVCANLIVVVALLLFMTHTDTQSDHISQYTKAISDLSIKNELLQQQVADAQKLSVISQKAQSLGMQEASNVLYLSNEANVYSYNIAPGQ